MDLAKCQELALEAMDKNGLLAAGWRFDFDNAKRRFGCCHNRLKLITLSRELVQLNNPLVVYNTILHEIAHALTPLDPGHGRQWREVAKSLGCDGARCYGDNVAKPQKAFRGQCPGCGRVIYRHRRNAIACGQCCRRFNGNRFSDKYLFNWTRSQ